MSFWRQSKQERGFIFSAMCLQVIFLLIVISYFHFLLLSYFMLSAMCLQVITLLLVISYFPFSCFHILYYQPCACRSYFFWLLSHISFFLILSHVPADRNSTARYFTCPNILICIFSYFVFWAMCLQAFAENFALISDISALFPIDMIWGGIFCHFHKNGRWGSHNTSTDFLQLPRNIFGQ